MNAVYSRVSKRTFVFAIPAIDLDVSDNERRQYEANI